MFNDLTTQAIGDKLSKMISSNNEPPHKQSRPLGFRESGARICAYRLSDCAICLSLEYGRGSRNSMTVMKYYHGWQLVDNHEVVIATWLDKVHEVEAQDA